MTKERNLSIELMKFIAVILVINSHFDPIYGKYSFLATGGAIGDVLFFFVSGFTIFLGRMGRFDNWYKRRIKRIYPSLLAWALLLSLFNAGQMNLSQICIGGEFWFIKCIMVYYVALYFVRRFAEFKPFIPFILTTVAILIWYLFEDRTYLSMYGGTYFKWLHYFLFMLAGAYVGNGTIRLTPYPLSDSLKLVMSIVLFYGIQILANHIPILLQLQVLTLVPLMGIVLYTYKLCCTEKVKALMCTNAGLGMRFLAGLCLESYIVQWFLINEPTLSNALMPLFPANLFITFVIIILAAFITRCLARVISQLFEKEDFNWNAVFEPVSR